MLRRFIVLGLLLLVGVLAIARDQTQSGSHIQGRSSQGWVIDVQGSQGIFTADGQVWTIEHIFRWFGQDGFTNLLWFIGRKPENYLLLFAYVNSVGTDFGIWFFDYKQAQGFADGFSGSYSVGSMQAHPSYLSGYVPKGRVPDYVGLDFVVNSPYAQITPASGTIFYKELQLLVYPIFYVPVVPESHEFWMISVDPNTNHTYHLIFYSNRLQTWVVDLWNGEISLLPLGQAVITGGTVRIFRNVSLGG